ncbi:MAG TPA: helix-turn-helix domain-containing protein [Candidatus Limnocylindrales bacterium]
MPTRESRPSRHPQRRQPGRRAALLAALRDAGRPLTVEDAARASGIAASTARFHLSLLVSAGEAERTPVRSGSAGRPSWQYTASAPPSPAAAANPGPYEALARVLAAQLDGETGAAQAAREAGRRWADTLPAKDLLPAASPAEAVAALTDAFDHLGFAPARPPTPDEIVLRACPFESVAREHRAVVCGVHLGLAEQTATSIGGGVTIDRLEPFRSEQPLTCAVRLRIPA